mmetsp:Transcript_73292/g.238460  ORF Transcript_73292/g.238460 Transcript_73292/m.238460 type:complete len:296 (+) Transcript_73292:4155-5042(+)
MPWGHQAVQAGLVPQEELRLRADLDDVGGVAKQHKVAQNAILDLQGRLAAHQLLLAAPQHAEGQIDERVPDRLLRYVLGLVQVRIAHFREQEVPEAEDRGRWQDDGEQSHEGTVEDRGQMEPQGLQMHPQLRLEPRHTQMQAVHVLHSPMFGGHRGHVLDLRGARCWRGIVVPEGPAVDERVEHPEGAVRIDGVLRPDASLLLGGLPSGVGRDGLRSLEREAAIGVLRLLHEVACVLGVGALRNENEKGQHEEALAIIHRRPRLASLALRHAQQVVLPRLVPAEENEGHAHILRP